MRLAVFVFAIACAHPKTCDDLTGMWSDPSGRSWMVLDHGAAIEAFPIFDDAIDSAAPRVIDLHRGAILRLQFQRLKKLSPRVRPAAGMHHLRSAHIFIRRVAITLQNALKLSQELLGAFAPPA